MKHFLLSAAAFLLASCATIHGAENDARWQKVDAGSLRIINRGFDDTERTYARLPAWLKDSVPGDLWDRQQCSSGLGVRFATDSRRIGISYHLYLNTHMIHMADTGLKGTDLYIHEGDSVWRHVNTNRPYVKNDTTKLVESEYVKNLDGKMHEYIVYFPLYDGIEDISIMIDEGSNITPGNPDLIPSDRRIVAYGTSILQGGCASRTGMAATNILSRELNAEVVNLGFSGAGRMDAPVGRALAAMEDVDVFLLDPIPNCTEMMCDTLTYDFVKTIVSAHPDTPVVYLAGPMYPYSRYDSFFGSYLPKKNEAARRNVERLQQEGYTNLIWLDSDNLDGIEDDGTVDGIHLTDLGFRHYADKLRPVLQEALEKKK